MEANTIMIDRPLITFALFAYNQEKYIREAVDGALSQAYSPLQIILSDDCSSDQTFEIMKEMAAAYVGCHEVILNQNKRNLGISQHVRAVHEMSAGELVVHAAGDDISYPSRTDKIVDAFLSEREKPSLIESNAELIDEGGRNIGFYLKGKEKFRKKTANPVLKLTLGGGCSYAIHRSLIENFEPPLLGILAEDGLINIRANMLNGVLYMPDVLMKYRLSSTGAWNGMLGVDLSSKTVLKNEVRQTKNRILIAKQAMLDVNQLKGLNLMSNQIADNNLQCLNESLSELDRWLILCEGPFLASATMLLRSIFWGKYIPLERWVKMYSIRWFPFARNLKAVYQSIKNENVVRG